MNCKNCKKLYWTNILHQQPNNLLFCQCNLFKESEKKMIEKMIGKKFDSITKNDSELVFICDEGLFIMYHEQDCCEDVHIESIVGDLNDLLYSPILRAEEVVTKGKTDPIDEYNDYSTTHTFYKLATKKGYVDIRWVGTSNGYYSESVDIDYRPFLY
jgi:hypothetical protein